MKLRGKLFQGYWNQRRLFDNNAEEILDSNLKILRQLNRISMLITLFMLVVVHMVPGYERLRLVYGLMCGGSLALWLFFRGRYGRQYALIGLYLVFSFFLCLAIYLSIWDGSGQMGVSIIGVLSLASLAFLDQSWRVDLFILFFYLVHTGASWALKPPSAALGDTVNCLCFTVVGILLGEHVRAIKLENHEVKRLTQMETDVDFLTGLYNRRKMLELMKRYGIGEGEHRIFGVIMLDIDHFKEYNDHYGHLKGDDCLRRLCAGLLEYGMRTGTDFFRYGGEEFLMFRYGEEQPPLFDTAEEIRALVWSLDIPYPDSEAGRVTVSLGCADVKLSGGQADKPLIMLADKALYRAKETGRNRSVCYSPQETGF